MRRCLAYLLGGCLVAVSGCLPASAPPRVWAASDMLHLTDRTPPAERGPAWDGDTKTLRLFAAANETVGFQLIVDAPPRKLAGVRVEIGALLGREGRRLPAGCVTLFRMLPVRVRQYPAWYVRLSDGPARPCGFYDVLVPIDAPAAGQPFDLAPNERLAVWVDLNVPRSALPDEYRAAVTVRYGDWERSLEPRSGQQRIDVALKVYDFVLPDVRCVPCVGGFSHEAVFRRLVRRPSGADGKPRPFVPFHLDTSNEKVREGLVIVRELMRLAHRHRLDLFDKTMRPLLKRDASGAVSLRWTDYDLIVKPYLNGTAFEDRIGVPAWPVPVCADWPKLANYQGPDTAAYRKVVTTVLARSAKHLELLGAGGRAFFWPRPGPAGPAGYQRFAALGRLARSAAPDLCILSELPLDPPPETTWTAPKDLAALADMLAPAANLVRLSQARPPARPERPLGGLWLQPGRPPYVGSCGVLAAPADVRALAWLAVKYRCAGLFLPETLSWEDDPFAAAAGPSAPKSARGEHRLFYPGRRFGLHFALPSVRLKWLRRGLQDVAYLWLLKQHQRGAVAEAMLGNMVHYAALDATVDHYQDPRLDGWVRDPEVWVLARRMLADEVLSAVRPEAVDGRQLLVQRLAWKKLAQRGSRVRVERVRSRVEPIASRQLRVTLSVELYNELPRPVRAELKCGPLPAGWRQAGPAGDALNLGGAERSVVKLILETDDVPIAAAGKTRIPLVLTTGLGHREELAAEVPLLRAGWTRRAPKIDGDLRDWPFRPGNAAGGFRLLGRRGRIGDGLADRQTTVYALHDETNLYLAFRCAEQHPDRLHALPNNMVRYDQLMACGEDLVEVIADPGRSAKTAEDLYHLVVKCNAALVAERGVGADPPLGRRRPWAVNARLAIGTQPGHWVVELAVPLAAFADRATDGLWRINFARFAAAGAESASWAGAARYYYHPDSLGTMILVGEDGQVRFPTTRSGAE